MNKLIVTVISFLVCSFTYGASTITSVDIGRRGGQVEVNEPLKAVKGVIELYGADINDRAHDYWDAADVCMLSDVCDGNIPYRSGNKWANGMKEVNAISNDGSGGSIKHYTDPNFTDYDLMHDKIVKATGDGNIGPATLEDLTDLGVASANDVNGTFVKIKPTIIQADDVTLSDANDGQAFYITTGDVNFTFVDANSTMLYTTYHFVNASTTTGKIMLHWDVNTTPYNAIDCCSLPAGGDYSIYPDGAANVLFHKTNKAMLTYAGDANAIP
jgi:hypothetical protein